MVLEDRLPRARRLTAPEVRNPGTGIRWHRGWRRWRCKSELMYSGIYQHVLYELITDFVKGSTIPLKRNDSTFKPAVDKSVFQRCFNYQVSD